MTTQIQDVATLDADATKTIASRDQGEVEAWVDTLVNYLAANAALKRVNAEGRHLSGCALIEYNDRTRAVREELIKYLTFCRKYGHDSEFAKKAFESPRVKEAIRRGGDLIAPSRATLSSPKGVPTAPQPITDAESLAQAVGTPMVPTVTPVTFEKVPLAQAFWPRRKKTQPTA